MYHFTYQTKNLINEMTYIGVHSTEDLEDEYLGSGVVLQKAIDKYGADNFRLIPLCFFDTKQEAFDEEEILVDEAWVKSRDNYNIKLGGQGGWDHIDHSKRPYRVPWNKGKKTPKHTIEKLIVAKVGKKRGSYGVGKNNPFYGKKHTEETKKKMSEAKKGKAPWNKGKSKYNENNEDN